MNKRIDLSNLGGFPLTEGTLEFMQESYREAFKALAQLTGDKVILSGVVVTGGAVSDGWVSYNGELIKFIGGGVTTDVFVQETSTEVTFQDNTVRPVYFTKVMKPGTPGDFPFADLVRLDKIKANQQALADLIAAFNIHTHTWASITDKPMGYVSYVGNVNIGDVGAGTPNVSLVNIAIPDQGTADYVVGGSLVSQAAAGHTADNNVFWIVQGQSATSFNLSLREISGSIQNLRFRFTITKSL